MRVRRVDPFDRLGEVGVEVAILGERLQVEGPTSVRRPLRDGLGVDRDQRGEVRATVTHDDCLADQRSILRLVSISSGAMFLPYAVMMRSFLRPVTRR